MAIMNLVRESKKKNLSKKEVWNSLITWRWTEEQIVNDNICLDESQESNVIEMAAAQLRLVHGIVPWVNGEDLAFGLELYSVIHNCPSHLEEAAKLSIFFESLLTNDNLNSVVAATMENIQPRAGDNIKDFTAINMWYERLDERYNFSLGSNILPLMTTDNLEQLAALDPPFMKEMKAVINDTQNDNTPPFFGKKCKCSFYCL